MIRGSRLRELRKNKGLSTRDVASIIGKSQFILYLVERWRSD